jgi:hypothetical protein
LVVSGPVHITIEGYITNMARIVINGREYTGSSVSIQCDTVIIDGEVREKGLSGVVEIRVVEGVIDRLESGASVYCGDVRGGVSAGGSVRCSNVTGSVTAGGSVKCENVEGSVTAGGSVKMR